PFYHLKRQLRFLVLGLFAAWVTLRISVETWRRCGWLLYAGAIGLLVLVLLPGIGREVNGSSRWLNLGVMTLQASEPAKLFVVLFLAHLLSQRNGWVREKWLGFLVPLALAMLP